MASMEPSDRTQETAQQRAMYPFSFDLHNGAHFFAEAAAAESDENRRRYFNIGAVVLAAAAIEAVLNEQISLRSEMGTDVHLPHLPKEFFEALGGAQKTISLKDKWNLFTSVRGGRAWDSGGEPFQSYDLLISLRNEVVHYKAEFLGDRRAPINKLQSLVDKLGTKPPPEEERDYSYWLQALMGSADLSACLRKILDYGQILDGVLKRAP